MAKKHESRPIATLKDNKVGTAINKANRAEALAITDTVTKDRAAQGWRWMQKGGTRKQVSPDNIVKHLAQDWKPL